MKRVLLFLLVFLLLFGVLGFYGLYQVNPYPFRSKHKAILSNFEDQLGISLPKEKKALLTEDDHGWMGDGDTVYIYELTPETMSDLLAEAAHSPDWRKLPMNGDLVLGLFEMLSNTTDERTRKYIRLGMQEGYFRLIDSNGAPLFGTDPSHVSFNNIMLGILDEKTNRVYLYKSDR